MGLSEELLVLSAVLTRMVSAGVRLLPLLAWGLDGWGGLAGTWRRVSAFRVQRCGDRCHA